MAKKEQVPAIRFQGFADPWEQRKLGDLVQFSKGTGYSKGDLRESGTPIILYGRLYTKYETVISEVDTFADAKAGSVYSRGGEVIVPASGETAEDISIASVVEKSGVLLGGDLNIITPPADLDAPFLAISISNGKPHEDMAKMAQGKSVVHLHNTDLEKIDLTYPSHEEQIQISGYFGALDHLITLHQRKYDKLVAIKRSMLEKMFPREGSRFPEIRFAGFTDPWEQRKLSEVFSSYTDPVDIPHDGYERLGIRSHAKGTFHNYVPAGHELQTAQMHRVAANKFIVNITFGWEHAVAVTDENDAGKLVSHRFPQFSLSDELDPQFLKFIILDERFRHHLWLASPGGAGRNRVLNLNQMLQYEIQIPCVAEQRKIAGALINIDILITLHQRKLEKLQAIKRSMLEKMFV